MSKEERREYENAKKQRQRDQYHAKGLTSKGKPRGKKETRGRKRKYTDEETAEKRRKYQREFRKRLYADPVEVQKRRDYQREWKKKGKYRKMVKLDRIRHAVNKGGVL